MHRRRQLQERRSLTQGQRGRVPARAIPLILDTGPLLAAIDDRDESHASCAELLAAAREPRVIPAPVLVELDYFLTRRWGPGPMTRVLNDVRTGAFEIEPLNPEDYERVS